MEQRLLSTSGITRVLLVANSTIMRAGLSALMANNSSLEVVGSVTNGEMLLKNEQLQPDVVLLVWDGEELIFDGEFQVSGMVVLVEDWQEVSIRNWLRNGVQGILPLQATGDEIVGAISAVALGLNVLHPDVIESLLSALPATAKERDNGKGILTSREVEVLGMLASGQGNKAIARRLHISEHTVKFHIASIFSKLDVSSRTEAVIKGAKDGLILL
ncbi:MULTISPECIES: response regulator transcription factor [Oscillatoriales]|uniref:response regulator transcription factor n=1 Tax=Oscillatoriophycideae TaxID=1301283 RepID=UPI0018EFAEFE|nr:MULTISPECIES: response regulator transcription factor [Oscillatoriales]